MENKEFSALALEVLKTARIKAKKEVVKKLDEAPFQVEIVDMEYGKKIHVWFFKKKCKGVLYNCTYDIEKNEFEEDI